MGAVDLSKKTVNLSKGELVNLSKQSEGLKKIMVGLGWDPANAEQIQSKGFFGKLFGSAATAAMATIDCDAWLALLSNGVLKSNKDIIYYGKKEFVYNGDMIVLHHGDNLTGEGEGDDEQISINLEKMPSEFDSIVIGVTIYKGDQKHQSFDNIKNTFIRVVDEKDNFEICRFNQSDMAEDKGSITFIAGKLYKDKGEWQFKAIGKGTKDKNIELAAEHYKYKS